MSQHESHVWVLQALSAVASKLLNLWQDQKAAKPDEPTPFPKVSFIQEALMQTHLGRKVLKRPLKSSVQDWAVIFRPLISYSCGVQRLPKKQIGICKLKHFHAFVH